MKHLMFFLLLAVGARAQVPPLYEHPVSFQGYTLRGTRDSLETGGAPYSLAGCTVKAEFRATPTSAPLLTFSTASGGGLTLAGASSNVLVWANRDLPTSAAPGIYYADIAVTFPDGTRLPLYRKKLELQAPFTRP